MGNMTAATDCDFMTRAAFNPENNFFAREEATADLYGFTAHNAHDIYDEINFEKRKDLRQDGKVVVITGARGIGRAIAVMFARAGAKAVAVGARTESQLEETKKLVLEANPKTAVHISGLDVTSDQSVKSFFEAVKTKFGTIDTVISNSGVNRIIKPVAETETDDWWHHFEVNLKGNYLTLKYFLQALDGKVGTFINISSSNAIAAIPTQAAYCSSKLGATRLLECVHFESPNLRVFSMHPGFIATDMSSPGTALYDIAWTKDTLELPAGLALYLTTSQAEFLRGRWIDANWRVDELEARREEIVSQNLLKTAFNAGLGIGMFGQSIGSKDTNLGSLGDKVLSENTSSK